MKNIIELIKSTPNDMELGKKIRDLYTQNKLVWPDGMYDDEYYKKQWVDPYHPTRKESFEYTAENPAV